MGLSEDFIFVLWQHWFKSISEFHSQNYLLDLLTDLLGVFHTAFELWLTCYQIIMYWTKYKTYTEIHIVYYRVLYHVAYPYTPIITGNQYLTCQEVIATWVYLLVIMLCSIRNINFYFILMLRHPIWISPESIASRHSMACMFPLEYVFFLLRYKLNCLEISSWRFWIIHCLVDIIIITHTLVKSAIETR